MRPPGLIGWPLALALVLGLHRAEVGATGEPAGLEAVFARILQLEDHRSAGAGELAGYLDPARPPAVRVRAALAIGRIGSPVTTPYDLVGALRDRDPELRRMAAFALG